jgi:hypothetical protein
MDGYQVLFWPSIRILLNDAEIRWILKKVIQLHTSIIKYTHKYLIASYLHFVLFFKLRN